MQKGQQNKEPSQQTKINALLNNPTSDIPGDEEHPALWSSRVCLKHPWAQTQLSALLCSGDSSGISHGIIFLVAVSWRVDLSSWEKWLHCVLAVLLGSDQGVHLHLDSLLHRQLSPWLQELKNQCLHEEHSVYLRANQLLPHFPDRCYWPLFMAHTQTPTRLLLPRHPTWAVWDVQHCLHPRWVQPDTCLRISLPSHNSQGSGPLPQKGSKCDLVCARLSRVRKANNHAGLSDKEQLCYMNTAPFCRTGASTHGYFQDHVGVRLVLCVCYKRNPSVFQNQPAFMLSW